MGIKQLGTLPSNPGASVPGDTASPGTAGDPPALNSHRHAREPIDGIFGDGSDGSLAFDGTTTHVALATTTGVAPNLVYTLIRDVTATSMTISSGITVNSGGFRILCTGTLTIAGVLQNNGGNGGNSGAAGTTAPRGSFGGATNAAGGAGGTGAGVQGNSIGNSIGGSGGAGGNGGTAGATAGGAAQTSPGLAAAGSQSLHFLPFALIGAYFGPSAMVAYGIGEPGSSGGGDGTNSGGGGGGGGGGIIIAAAIVAFNAANCVTANGGSGGSPATAASAKGDGGGGGGGGGFIIVITSSDISSHTLITTGGEVAGGIGGTGKVGAGATGVTNGGNGASGTLQQLLVS